MLKIISLRNDKANELNCLAWDRYIENHPYGTFFHINSWRLIQQRNFLFKDHSFAIKDNKGNIKGGLPLMMVKTITGKEKLISVPNAIGGGILYDDDEIKDAIIKHVYNNFKSKYVEFREVYQNIKHDLIRQTTPTHSFFTFVLPNKKENLLLTIPSNTRAGIRKGLKLIATEKLQVRREVNLDVFYDLYAYNLWSKGTPIASKKYFEDLLNYYKQSISMIFLYDNHNMPVSVILSYSFKDHFLPYYLGYSKQARKLHGNEQVLYQTMLYAIEKGFKHYDFGRSQIDSGAYHFKRHFGVQPQRLYYCSMVTHGKVTCCKKGSQEMMQLSYKKGLLPKLSYLWTKLPFSLSKFIGPIVAKYFA